MSSRSIAQYLESSRNNRRLKIVDGKLYFYSAPEPGLYVDLTTGQLQTF